MIDDAREKRWTITVCPECWEYRPYTAIDAVHGRKPTCSCWGLVQDEHGAYVGSHGPDVIEVDVVPLDRAEKAEAAARDFAGCLRDLAVSGAFRDGSGGMVRVAKALARHPEFAPGPSPPVDIPTANQ